MNRAITIPARGALPAPEDLERAERQVALMIDTIDDMAELEDMRDRFGAIEAYLRKKQLHLPALGAQRRLEARIGQLLGEPEIGRPEKTSVMTEVSDVGRHDRHDFRILAGALDGDIALTDDEWRQSRRALVELVRARIAEKERDMEHACREAGRAAGRAGPRLNIPENMTAEDLCRKGLEMEAAGASTDEVARAFGIADHNYRRMREVVLLADRGNFNEHDARRVAEALNTMNDTRQIVRAAETIEPVAARVWGEQKNGKTSGPASEAKRLERFEHAFGIVMHGCLTAAEMDIPYLSEQRARAALREIAGARRNLKALQRRIEEIFS